MIELTDVLFAVDSVPAVLAISHDTFVVYTSNIMAILGLRALYFVLSGMMGRFHHLGTGLALILIFIGAKMIAGRLHFELPTWASLSVIVLVLCRGRWGCRCCGRQPGGGPAKERHESTARTSKRHFAPSDLATWAAWSRRSRARGARVLALLGARRSESVANAAGRAARRRRFAVR